MTSATMVEVKPPLHPHSHSHSHPKSSSMVGTPPPAAAAHTHTHPHPHTHPRSPGPQPQPQQPPAPPQQQQQQQQVAPVPPRVHTLDLKAKLAAALGANGKRYWDALLHFSTATISRDEFEEEARSCLRPEHVHLHNALVLGILYNASSAVPGPSSASGLGYGGASSMDNGAHPDGSHSDQNASGNGGYGGQGAEGQEDHHAAPLHPRKRLRLLAASLATNERQRLKASGKPQARNLASGASASSWAGAGADLLERKRKEEEKKQKEADRKRLRETHTQIGSPDWTRDVLAEEATRQENRPKLTVATLQALLRSNKVPTCIEAKRLPDADALADLMTSQAVEAGLNSGVAPEAAALLLAGVQAHLQNVASSMILAVRANRAAGGIRTSRHERDRISDDTGEAANRASYPDSPVAAAHPQLPDGVSSYPASYPAIRMHRPDRSTHSSRNSSSSNSASTVVSSIFTSGSAGAPQKRYMQTGSGPDASTISFVSTAPTTHVAEDTPAGSSDGMDIDREADREKLGDGDPDGDPDESTDSRADDSGVVISDLVREKPSGAQPLPLPNRPLYGRKRRRSAGAHDGSGGPPTSTSKLTLRDVAFLLELSPHFLVEPFGVGAMEKLLAPDADDCGDDGTGSDPDDADADADFGQEERLALAARLCAFSKQGAQSQGKVQSSSTAASASAAASTSAPTGRNRYLVDQQGPLSLLLARSVLDERRGSGSANVNANVNGGEGGAGAGAGTTTNSADKDKAKAPAPAPPGKRPRNAGAQIDPLSDVVDPVKLLAGLCD